jgi:hypothetical protein
MTDFPIAIRFLTDGSEAFLVEEITNTLKSKDRRVANYQFCVSIVNEGYAYPLCLDDLQRLYSFKLIEIIE